MLRVYFTLLFLLSCFAQTVEAQNPFNLLDVFKKNSEEPAQKKQNSELEEIPLTLPVPIDQPANATPAVVPAAPPIEEPKETPKVTAPVVESPVVDDPFGFATPTPAPTTTPSTIPSVIDPTNPPAPQPIVQTPVGPQPNQLITPSIPFQETIPVPAPEPIPVPNSISNSNLNPNPARGYFGAVVKSLPKGQAGIQIMSVTPSGPAAAAGLQAGDRLLSMADSPLTSEAEVKQIMDVLSPGDRIELEIYRDRRRMKKALVIGTMPGSQIAQAANVQTPKIQSQNIQPNIQAPREDFPVVPVPSVVNSGQQKPNKNASNVVQQRPRIGITVVDATDVIRSGLRSRVVNGGGIESIEARSPAAVAGLSVGALIVAVNDTPVESSGEIVNLISRMRPGQQVNVTFYENRQLKRTTVKLGGEPIKVQQASARVAARTDPRLQPNRSTQVQVDPRFQPVPGAQFESAQIVERPIMKRIGENMPLIRRIDNMIDRFSVTPAPATYSQPQVQPVVPTQSRAEERQLEEIIRAQQLQIQIMNQRLQQLETKRRR